MVRLAVLGLSHEANTFSACRVDEAVFDATGVLRGDQIVRAHAGGTTTIAGYLSAGARHGVELVPLVMTTLVPSGIITAQALATRTEELVESLKAGGPFDGLLVSLHGAAVAEGVTDVDGDLLRRFREAVGPDVPIGVSLDLHANVSAQMCAHADVVNTYRTNPHVDAAQVAEEVADVIIRTVRREVRPILALEQVPAAVGILAQNTVEPPMSDIMADARALRAEPGVLSVSVAEGYPYADVAEMGMAVVVVTDDDSAAAVRAARTLAQRVWARREQFDPPAPSAAEALRAAARAERGPVLLLDVGDNIGGGSPGDSVSLLNAARDIGFTSLLTVVADPVAAAACTGAGVGVQMDLSIGAASDPATGPAVLTRATVLALHDGVYKAPEAVHAGMRYFDAGPSAAVRLDTGQTVILTSRPVMPLSTGQLRTLGLAPEQFTAIVAKGVHSPLAGYLPYVSDVVRVNTPGITGADLSRFAYEHRRRPMYPFEPETTYRPEPTVVSRSAPA